MTTLRCRLCHEDKPLSDFPIVKEKFYERCRTCLKKIPLIDVYLRDRGICALCKTRVNWMDASLEHLIPISRGGEHTWENIALSHVSCNLRKGSKLVEEL